MMFLSKAAKSLSSGTGAKKFLLGKAPVSTECLDSPLRNASLENMQEHDIMDRGRRGPGQELLRCMER
ncbi:hypothetical protein ILYODFUR_008274 [Ilyodon furcidens]|uniref:Uncharacterized protein n=1 Tax=Ilyodon furcidens TaxID=33524 RepID=A0ABV0SLN6_9TELE